MTAQKFIEKKFFNRHFFLDAINENERDVIEFIADLMDEYAEQLRQSNVVGQSEQYFCSKEQIGQRCNEQCLGCFQFENKD